MRVLGSRRGRWTARLVVGLGITLACARDACAGMPTPTVLLGQAARRLDVISFFLLVFFGVAWGIQKLWNLLRRDFPVLPRLSYKHAIALIALWGLAFNLVLTMISGARELMTPGAWVPQGATYRLKGGDKADSGGPEREEQRRERP